ncbi:MAG: CopG family antitoxin [Spirochaetales bacterium]|nr:CopG family antitoxin [Spirochaetales bacterium]
MIPISAQEKARVNAILDKARKNRVISLRISEQDLGMLKEKAAREGMPYQTLINSVLHKYITNQLLDKDEALKSLGLIQQQNQSTPE